MSRGSGLGIELRAADVPLVDGAAALAGAGFVTGASGRNWNAYGDEIRLGGDVCDTMRALLTDPQTSGGLLVACAPDSVGDVLAIFASMGFAGAVAIGRVIDGPPRVEVV